MDSTEPTYARTSSTVERAAKKLQEEMQREKQSTKAEEITELSKTISAAFPGDGKEAPPIKAAQVSQQSEAIDAAVAAALAQIGQSDTAESA